MVLWIYGPLLIYLLGMTSKWPSSCCSRAEEGGEINCPLWTLFQLRSSEPNFQLSALIYGMRVCVPISGFFLSFFPPQSSSSHILFSNYMFSVTAYSMLL